MRMLVLTLLALMMVTISGQASAQTETVWAHWGAAPFASSKDEALTKLPEVLKLLQIPEAVRPLFRAKVTANPQGKRIYVVPNDHFTAMMSKGDKVLHNVVVAEIPVQLKNGKTGVSQAANASEWEVEFEGRTYVLVLPDICNNWAWRSFATPRPREVTPSLECAELYVPHVMAGDTVTVKFRPEGTQLPPSECWGHHAGVERLSQDSSAWKMWPGCLNCFQATTNGMTLRLPVSMSATELAICVNRNGKPSCVWVIEASDWKPDHTFEVPEWKWVYCAPVKGS